jgi:hypothetical protein
MKWDVSQMIFSRADTDELVKVSRFDRKTIEDMQKACSGFAQKKVDDEVCAERLIVLDPRLRHPLPLLLGHNG